MRYLLAIGIVAVLGAGTARADENEKANAFFEAAFQEKVSRSPMRQARLGLKTSYDQWDDLSDAFAIESVEVVKRQLAALRETIDRDALGDETRLSYDLFVDAAEEEIASHRFRFHTYPVNQMFGWQSSVPSFLINYHRIDSLEDAECYIRRLERVEPLFEQLVVGLRARAEKGIVAPKFVFPHVLSDSRNIISGAPFDDSGEDGTLLADFREKVAALEVDDAARQKLIERASDALRGPFRAGYDELIACVTGLEESATADDGVWKLPDGAEFYRHRLERITTTTLSAEEIHATGLAEVARIHDEMRAIMKKVEFEGSLQDFFEFMRTDEQFYLEDTAAGRKAYLDRATHIIEAMRERLDELFITKPKADLIVKAVEAFRERSAGKAFYQRPSPDGSRPGVYYANLYRMADMPTYQAEALAYHEAIPGHHMQLAIAGELTDLPQFRRYGGYTAHSEGWGLYSEYVPKEIGFYEDPYSDFGRLAMELWRACRLVVDTGIHDKRWTRQKAIDYLIENTPNPEGDAVKAIERYIVMPGQATAYKIGMLKILELREAAREALGDRFDIRAFHDVVLRNGPVPLTTLETLVDRWVAGSKGAAKDDDGSGATD